MTDEHQVRALLTRAAELPDNVQPSVARLVESARRTRRLRAVGSVVAVVAVAAALFGLPHALGGQSPGHSVASGGARRLSGPTAVQLARFHWARLTRSPLGTVSNPLLVWTGQELLELGGRTNGTLSTQDAAYNPATRTWRGLAPIPNPILLGRFVTSVWTGRELFVTSGRIPSWDPCCPGAPAGFYDPARNRWSYTVMPRQLLGARQLTAVWTGRVIVVAGVQRGHIAAAAYNPATHRWKLVSPTLPPGHPAAEMAIVASNHRVIVWSLWSRTKRTAKNGYSIGSGIDVLALGPSGRWANVTGRWPQRMDVHGPIYGRGSILIPAGHIWCGEGCHIPIGSSPARLADASTLALTTVAPGPLVGHRASFEEPPIWLWSGGAVLAANLDYTAKNAPGGRLSKLAAWDPISRRWYVLPSAPGRPALGAGPIYANDRVLVLTQDGSLLSLQK
jgi:hypothetical protein